MKPLERMCPVHLQVILWKDAVNPEPSDLNPTEFVWEKGNNGELN